MTGCGPPRWLLWLLAATVAATTTTTVAAVGERERYLDVSESAPPGTRIGFVDGGDGGGGGGVGGGGPPYLIVPVPGSAADSDLVADQSTGEIRTRVPLDRETRPSYTLVAIPSGGGGETVRVVVRVTDENDNAPAFPAPSMRVEFPENTARDTKRTLHPARDPDLGRYNTQRYAIVSGNTGNAFRLSTHRERDGVLYLDLQINGCLDRETVPAYRLVVEAYDGGTPPLRGSMAVDVTVLDVNDNQPAFEQSRYYGTVPENATVSTSVLRVRATDVDDGENGEVEYTISRRQSDRDGYFAVDRHTGVVTVNRPLDYETRDTHELVVVARDRGGQPLEATAFVTVRVLDVNDNRPDISVIFLSDDATAKVSERAQPGEFVARISVRDPDASRHHRYAGAADVNVTLQGGDGHFGLTTRDNVVYLVIVALPLDREIRAEYTLSVIATDAGNPPLRAVKTFQLLVADVNDNRPEFGASEYWAAVSEAAEPGTPVVQVSATDRDEAENAAVAYRMRDPAPQWFQVDARTGVVSTRDRMRCDRDPEPAFVVLAVDDGRPHRLTGTATVHVTVHDLNDNEPTFDRSYYAADVPEDRPVGSCVLKVRARLLIIIFFPAVGPFHEMATVKGSGITRRY